MIVQKDFLKKLKDFGLNTYESKLWTALLSRGVSTAGELSDIANVPRSRSYDVLESLEKKGFIVMKLGKPIKYIAVPPEEVLERVKKKISEETTRQVKAIEELKGSEILSELKILHNQGVELIEPSDISGSIKGRHNVYNHLESALGRAEKTVIIATTSKGLLRKAESLKPALDKLKQKGVKVRIAAPINKDNKAVATALKSVADVRDIGDVKARFVLVDGEDLTFMLLDDEEIHSSYDVGIWVKTPFFAKAVETMFDTSWKNMKDASQINKQ